jgi:hypothetical protein
MWHIFLAKAQSNLEAAERDRSHRTFDPWVSRAYLAAFQAAIAALLFRASLRFPLVREPPRSILMILSYGDPPESSVCSRTPVYRTACQRPPERRTATTRIPVRVEERLGVHSMEDESGAHDAVAVALVELMPPADLGPHRIPRQLHKLDALQSGGAAHVLVQIWAQLRGLKVEGVRVQKDHATGHRVLDDRFDARIGHRGENTVSRGILYGTNQGPAPASRGTQVPGCRWARIA